MKIPVFKSPQDVLAVGVRRKWWILVVSTASFTVVAIAVILLPNIYESKTLIVVEPRDVPTDVVKEFVLVKTQQRLAAIQQTVLSRSTLLRLAKEFEDEFTGLSNLDDDSKVARLRHRIDVAIASDRRARNPVVSYFTISFEDEIPAVAQKVTSRLTSLFIEQDNRVREEKVFGTVEFLRTEKEKVSVQLLMAEEELSRYKHSYLAELPGSLNANLRTLDRLQGQLAAAQEAYDRQMTLKLNLDTQLATTSKELMVEENSRFDPTPTRIVSPLVAEYKEKHRLLRDLQIRYTDKHPDVMALSKELDRLKTIIPPEDFVEVETSAQGPSYSTRPNPVYQQLVARKKELDTELSITNRNRVSLQAEMDRIGALVEKTPYREQDLAKMQRNYDELYDKHASLENNLAQAELAGSLETRQKGEQFTVVDSASLPINPSKPNRSLILLGGLLGSLALGVLLGFAVDFAGQKVWNHSEIEGLLGVPVLVEIPEIVSETDFRGAQWRRRAAYTFFGLFCLICSGTTYLIWAKPSINRVGSELITGLLQW